MPRITPVHWTVIERLVVRSGLKFDRQRGSHRAYVGEALSMPVIIPVRPEVPVAIIRNILKTLALSREDYFRLIGE